MMLSSILLLLGSITILFSLITTIALIFSNDPGGLNVIICFFFILNGFISLGVSEILKKLTPKEGWQNHTSDTSSSTTEIADVSSTHE